MLNLDDDGYSTSECGPQHSTPIKPQCFQYQPSLLHGSYTSYSSNKTSAPVTGRHSRLDNSRNTNHRTDWHPGCAECLSDSDVSTSKKTAQHSQSTLEHSQQVLLEKMKSAGGSRFFMDSCATDKEVSVSDKKSNPRYITPKSKTSQGGDGAQESVYVHNEAGSWSPGSTAIFLEQDIINKQRHEIQILMEELGTRDQELNDLVASHQRQVQAWEVERDKFQLLQSRLNSYQDELISNDQQLKETLAEMSRVNEQREADAKEFKRTQNEMEKLAERIKENSHYIKEMEFQNKSLNATIKDLMAERKSWVEREAELLKDMDEKECQLSERRAEWKKMKDHMEFLQARCEELEEKNLNLATEASTWKKKYCNAQDDADKLIEEVTIKEENIQKMTQQLHESLQQAIALQKALFTSCEREKCKEEVMYSLRKQHKRTMQELQNIRELYDRQNRDLTLYHLSVREAHETKQKESQENQRQKDEEDKRNWVNIEEEKLKREEKYRRDKNMSSHKDRLGSSAQDSECSYLLKRGRSTMGTGSDTQLDVQTERSAELSCSAGHTVRCHNVSTITSSTTQLSDDRDSQQGRSRGRNCLSSSYAENISRNATDKRCSSDSRSNSSQKPKKKVTRSRTTSPILTRKCSPQKDKPVWQKAGPSKGCQRRESSSDASHLTSPTKFDDDLTPADSDGMCHELKRDISHIGKENCTKQQSKSSSNSWRKSALSNPNKPSLKSLSNLWDAPATKRSSFLKKDRVEKRISFSAEDEDTQNSPGGGVEKVSSDVARRVEDSGYGTARNPTPPPIKSPTNEVGPSHDSPVSPSYISTYSEGNKTSDHKHSNQDVGIHTSSSNAHKYSEGNKTSDHKHSNQDGDIHTSPSYIPKYSEGNKTSSQDVHQHASPSTTRKQQGLAGQRSPCAKSKSPSQDGSHRKSPTEIKKRTCYVCPENRSPKEKKKEARGPPHGCQCHAQSSKSDQQSAPDREVSLCLPKTKKKVLEETPEELETRKLSSYAMMVPGYIHATERKASIDRNTSPLIMMSPSVSRKEAERPSTVDLSEPTYTSTSYELKDRQAKKSASKSLTAVKKVSYMDQQSPPTEPLEKSSVSERLDVSPMVLMNCPRSKELKQHKRRRKSQSPIAGFPPRKGKMKITVEYSDEDENSSEEDEKREVCKCQKKSKSCCEFARAYKRRSSKPDLMKSHGIYSCSDGLLMNKGDSLYCQKLYKPASGHRTLLDDKLRFCSDLRRSYPDNSQHSSLFDHKPYKFKVPKVDPFLGQQTYASKMCAIPSDVGTYLSLYCNNNKSQDSQSDVGCHSDSQSEADCHSNNSSQKEITKATQQTSETSGHPAQHVMVSTDGLNSPEGRNLDPSVGTKLKLSNPSNSADSHPEEETSLSQHSLDESAGGPSSTERNYYYTETRSTSSSTEEDSKSDLNIKKSNDSTIRKNMGSLKPFSNTKKPSLYKHLSKIHFSEKTRRYEWVRSDEDKVELYNDRSGVGKELPPACQNPPPACLEEQLVSRYLVSEPCREVKPRAASTCCYGNKNSNNMQQYDQVHSAFTDVMTATGAVSDTDVMTATGAVSDRWDNQSYDRTPSTQDTGFSESHEPAAGVSQSHEPADPVIRRLEFDNLTLDESDIAACHLAVNMAAGVVSGTLIPGRDIPVRDVGQRHVTDDLLADVAPNSSPAPGPTVHTPLDCCLPHHPSSMSRAVDDYLSKTKAGQSQAKSTHFLPRNQFPLERKILDTLTGSLRSEMTELPERPNDSVFIPDQHHTATRDQTSSVIYPPINETNNKCTNNVTVLTPSLQMCERVLEHSVSVSNSCESVGHSETCSHQDLQEWRDQWNDQFSEKLSSFLADPADSTNQSASWTSQHKLAQMSPSSKLLKLLTESQEMLRLLEESSAIPESIRVKVKAVGGHPLLKVPI